MGFEWERGCERVHLLQSAERVSVVRLLFGARMYAEYEVGLSIRMEEYRAANGIELT